MLLGLTPYRGCTRVLASFSACTPGNLNCGLQRCVSAMLLAVQAACKTAKFVRFAYLLLLALLTVLQSLDHIFSLRRSNSTCVGMICDQHCNVALQALKKVLTKDLLA